MVLLYFERNLCEVLEPEIDWKIKLWNFLVRTPSDFGGFDRRLIHSGTYLENFNDEPLLIEQIDKIQDIL